MHLYALLIGIDAYLPNHLPTGHAYYRLAGAVSDVQGARRFLMAGLNLSPDRIVSLTASITTQSGPAEPQEHWPSYENIVNSCLRLFETVQAGDEVYIHYCGHGGLTPTLAPELKGASGLDISLVPFDIGTRNGRYLTDLELALLMHKFADKGVQVTLVLDCSFAEPPLTATAGITPRGLGVVDSTPRRGDSLLGQRGELVKNWRRYASLSGSADTMPPVLLPQVPGCTVLFACASSETAYERALVAGGVEGVFSHYLVQELWRLPAGSSYHQLYNRVGCHMQVQFPQQTAQLQGELERLVFGRWNMPAPGPLHYPIPENEWVAVLSEQAVEDVATTGNSSLSLSMPTKNQDHVADLDLRQEVMTATALLRQIVVYPANVLAFLPPGEQSTLLTLLSNMVSQLADPSNASALNDAVSDLLRFVTQQPELRAFLLPERTDLEVMRSLYLSSPPLFPIAQTAPVAEYFELLKLWAEASQQALTEALATSTTSNSPAYLNTRFSESGSRQPITGSLRVGRKVTFAIRVDPQLSMGLNQHGQLFQFSFPDEFTPVTFRVAVHGPPDSLTILPFDPTLIVAPPGRTLQEATFYITPRVSGTSILHITVTQETTGAVVHHSWVPMLVGEYASPDSVLPPVQSIRFPLDAQGIQSRSVEMTFYNGGSNNNFQLEIAAQLPQRVIRNVYTLPLTPQAVQGAAVLLHNALNNVVRYKVSRGTRVTTPFNQTSTLAVDEQEARRAIAPLADAGLAMWQMLFQQRTGTGGIQDVADQFRTLPHGSTMQVVLHDSRMVIPWLLLYDHPTDGPVTPENLDWQGFWGYRYIFDILVPGDYPQPLMQGRSLAAHALLNDDARLRPFTSATEQFMHTELDAAPGNVIWGHEAVRKVLPTLDDSDLLYLYCHGSHDDAAQRAGGLSGYSSLVFSDRQHLRLVDLQRISPTPFRRPPLAFLNACEGAARGAFEYDGFMRYFIEMKRARAFIGAETKVPSLLAHHLGIDFLRAFARGEPIGKVLWQLRRSYLDDYQNILAFAYVLYGLSDTRLV